MLGSLERLELGSLDRLVWGSLDRLVLGSLDWLVFGYYTLGVLPWLAGQGQPWSPRVGGGTT